MYRLIALIAFCLFLFILWTIYLANTGGSSIFFDLVKLIPYGDKVGHVGLFGGLALSAIIGSKFHSFSLGWLTLYTGAVVIGIFALGEELSQYFIQNRTFDLFDLTADAIGILLAIGFAHLLKNFVKRSHLHDRTP